MLVLLAALQAGAADRELYLTDWSRGDGAARAAAAKVAHEREDALHACATHERRLEIELTIAAGRVDRAVTIARSGDEAVDRCVVDAIRGWTFPAGASGTFRWELELATVEDDRSTDVGYDLYDIADDPESTAAMLRLPPLSLEPGPVHDVFQAHVADFATCARIRPEGVVVLRARIDVANGRVYDATVHALRGDAPGLEACVEERIPHLRFPADLSGPYYQILEFR